jgi:hypothetical protein
VEPPSCHPKGNVKLTLALRADANDRRHLVGEDRREQRQVARSIMRRAEPIADSGLAFGQAVQVAHRADAYGAHGVASTRFLLAPFSPASYRRLMPDPADNLTPADPRDLADAVAFALR